VHVDIHEQGDDSTVVLIHAQVMGPELWGPLLPALPARLLVPHLPGYGRSAALRCRSFDELHARLETALAPQVAGPVHLVGFSISALHAVALALRGRIEARSLYLIGPVLGLDVELLSQFAGLQSELDAGRLPLIDVFVSRCVTPEWASANPASVAAFRERLSSANVLSVIEDLRQLAHMPDLRPRLGEVKVPVTLRVGEADAAAPASWARDYAAKLPASTLEVVPGAAHHLVLQDLEGTAASLRRHLGVA
jgi:pimeloyl-ACP methyl ester carboxylesterase